MVRLRFVSWVDVCLQCRFPGRRGGLLNAPGVKPVTVVFSVVREDHINAGVYYSEPSQTVVGVRRRRRMDTSRQTNWWSRRGSAIRWWWRRRTVGYPRVDWYCPCSIVTWYVPSSPEEESQSRPTKLSPDDDAAAVSVTAVVTVPSFLSSPETAPGALPAGGVTRAAGYPRSRLALSMRLTWLVGPFLVGRGVPIKADALVA